MGCRRSTTPTRTAGATNPVIFRATEQWFISMETPMTAPDRPTTFRQRLSARARQRRLGPVLGTGAHL